MRYIIAAVVLGAISAMAIVNRTEIEAYISSRLPGAAADVHAPADHRSKNAGAQTGAAQGGTRASAVTVAVARSGSLPIVRQTIGTIIPVASTALGSPTSGIVANVLVKDGQEVKTGDLLVQLDDRMIRANIQRDQSVLARDQAILDAANATLKRVEMLSKSGVDTQQQFSDAAASVKQAEATVSVDHSVLAADNVTLSQTQIRAPFDGRLGAVLLSPGAYVAPGTDVVLLTQMNPVFAEFLLPEPDLALARASMDKGLLSAQIYTTSRQGKDPAGSGNIVFIDNSVDPASGTFKLRAHLENEAETFWPGQSLKVTVNAGTVDNLVIVPSVAVQPQGGAFICYVVRPDKTVELRTVTLAPGVGDMAGISQGLAEGEMVVTEGQASLVEGSHVTISGTPDGSTAKVTMTDEVRP